MGGCANVGGGMCECVCVCEYVTVCDYNIITSETNV